MKSGPRNRQIQRRERKFQAAFVGPRAAGREVDDLDGELGSFLSGTCFGERQKEAGVGTGTGVARPNSGRKFGSGLILETLL